MVMLVCDVICAFAGDVCFCCRFLILSRLVDRTAHRERIILKFLSLSCGLNPEWACGSELPEVWWFWFFFEIPPIQVTTITCCRRCHIYSRDMDGHASLISGPIPGPDGPGNGPSGRTGEECRRWYFTNFVESVKLSSSTYSGAEFEDHYTLQAGQNGLTNRDN